VDEFILGWYSLETVDVFGKLAHYVFLLVLRLSLSHQVFVASVAIH